MSSWSEPRMRGQVLRGVTPADYRPPAAPESGPVLRGLTPADQRPPAPPAAEPTAIDLAVVRSRAARELVVDPTLVEEALEEGYRMGYDAGFQAGLEDSAAAVQERERARDEQVRTAIAALLGAAEDLRHRETTARTALEDQIVAAAFAIAETIVGHELRHAEQRGRDALARALALTPEDGLVTARLHPDDLATVGDVETLAPGRALEIVADPTLSPGDCLLDVEACRIDARIGTALDRVREVLGG